MKVAMYDDGYPVADDLTRSSVYDGRRFGEPLVGVRGVPSIGYGLGTKKTRETWDLFKIKTAQRVTVLDPRALVQVGRVDYAGDGCGANVVRYEDQGTTLSVGIRMSDVWVDRLTFYYVNGGVVVVGVTGRCSESGCWRLESGK